jgi:hypothetical protein
MLEHGLELIRESGNAAIAIQIIDAQQPAAAATACAQVAAGCRQQ